MYKRSLALCLSYQGKFKEAAMLYKKVGQEEKVHML